MWGWGGGAAPGVTGLLWGRGPACCPPRSAVLGASPTPAQPPHPTPHTKLRGWGSRPVRPPCLWEPGGCSPSGGKGVRGAARCGIPGVLLALPGAGHVERPSPAPLGRAGTGDPGGERDERDTGPSSLLMSASGRDRLLPVATRPSALGPARATGNAAGATGRC